MKYIFAFFTIILASAVLAEKRPFERYQTIIDRRPFGQPPPGYNPEQFASEAARNPGKTEAELSKEQQQLQKAVALFAINIDPDGSTMVGFSDMSDPKSPAYYYMPVGETRNGWFVKEASPSSTNAFMTVVKDGVRQLIGYTFESENPEDLARQIATFVQQGRNDENVEFGRQHVMQNYSVQKTALQYLDEYRKVLGHK